MATRACGRDVADPSVGRHHPSHADRECRRRNRATCTAGPRTSAPRAGHLGRFAVAYFFRTIAVAWATTALRPPVPDDAPLVGYRKASLADARWRRIRPIPVSGLSLGDRCDPRISDRGLSLDPASHHECRVRFSSKGRRCSTGPCQRPSNVLPAPSFTARRGAARLYS